MPATVIIGAQFGDEGKGKITDMLAGQHDIVARFNGGNNAGHTVVVGEEQFKFHLLPSGIIRKKHCCLGPGVVIDPRVLVQEIRQMGQTGFSLSIDPRCHVIFPFHSLLDNASHSPVAQSIGTTGRGIGPCYADKIGRTGLRVADLVDKSMLEEKLAKIFPQKEKALRDYGIKDAQGFSETLKEYSDLGSMLSTLAADVSVLLCNAMKEKKAILFEGAQGTFLDNSFGTYPFVTSSHTLAANAFLGTGLPPSKPDKCIGVAKAYATRVGNGPFPTEISGELAERIVSNGKEFGTTTGRKRRVGWLDLPMLRTAARLNGFTEIALTKIDVLSGIKKLLVCTHYENNGKELKEWPVTVKELEQCKPIYREVEGFELSGKEKEFAELDANARQYIETVEAETSVPVKIVSVGAERSQTIFRN